MPRRVVQLSSLLASAASSCCGFERPLQLPAHLETPVNTRFYRVRELDIRTFAILSL